MKNFWSQIWNAEWLADTGLPLLLSLIALYVAYRFLKAQFKHDAGLIAEQFAHDRTLVAEERRRSYAQRYVEDARQAVDDLSEIDRAYGRDDTDEANFRAIFTRSKEVFERLSGSASKLTIALGPSDLTRAAKTVAAYHLLRISTFAEAPELRRNPIPFSFVGLEAIVRQTLLEQWLSHLLSLAAILDTWDGAEPLPRLIGSLSDLDLLPVGPSEATPEALTEAAQDTAQWVRTQRGKFTDEIANFLRIAPTTPSNGT